MLEIFAKDPISKCDVIIVEGYKKEDIPKIEVFRREIGKPFLYKDDDSPQEKINLICSEIYRADKVNFSGQAIKKLDELNKLGFNHFPVCMAKTQYSFSTDAKKKCAPENHTIEIREIRVSAGAEFIVAIAGEIMTMPGLPKKPAAYEVKVDDDGNIQGLF